MYRLCKDSLKEDLDDTRGVWEYVVHYFHFLADGCAHGGIQRGHARFSYRWSRIRVWKRIPSTPNISVIDYIMPVSQDAQLRSCLGVYVQKIGLGDEECVLVDVYLDT